MPDKPTFGRYAEIPHEQMTPEQQEAYSSLIETPRQASRAQQDLGAQSQTGEGRRDRSAPISNQAITP
jgi:hypothetical protein